MLSVVWYSIVVPDSLVLAFDTDVVTDLEVLEEENDTDCDVGEDDATEYGIEVGPLKCEDVADVMCGVGLFVSDVEMYECTRSVTSDVDSVDVTKGVIDDVGVLVNTDVTLVDSSVNTENRKYIANVS